MKVKVLRGSVGTTAAQVTATSTKTRWFKVKALNANSGDLYVEANSSIASTTGFQLDGGETLEVGNLSKMSYDDFDLSDLYVIGSAASQGWAVIYV